MEAANCSKIALLACISYDITVLNMSSVCTRSLNIQCQFVYGCNT